MKSKYRVPNSKYFKLNAISAAVSMGLLLSANSGLAQNDEPTVEEVIVTGSYIRRSVGFSVASPITQLDAADLEAQGTVNMAQIVQNLTFNNGTGVSNTIQGPGNSTADFNLRGLGGSATLLLMDGKRTPLRNIKAQLPGIAIQRIDIVTDGAAALYGTDAVAGVVNLIPYTSFDGFKMEYYEERDERSDYSDKQVSFLFGSDLSDRISVVGAGSFQRSSVLLATDRPKFQNAGLTANAGGKPGEFLVPTRDENGLLTGEPNVRKADPSCGSLPITNPAKNLSNPFGYNLFGRCLFEFGYGRDYRDAMFTTQLFGNVDFEVNDDLNLSAQVNFARINTQGRNNLSNPGGKNQNLPVVRGEIPGNLFRAMNASGAALFAQPRMANGSMILDAHGRPLPFRGANGQVVLASNQFASINNDPNGGVPFYEDVLIAASWNPVGPTDNPLPQGFNSDGSNPAETDDQNWRIALTADFTVPFLPDWEGTAFYTAAKVFDHDTQNQDWSTSAMVQGLNCDVIRDVESCYNPFGIVEQRFANSQQVADAVWTKFREGHEDTFQTFDLVFNGTIRLGDFELAGGEIGAAIGYQRRDDRIRRIPPAGDISGDSYIGNQIDPFAISRSSDSYFGELSLPVLSNLNVSLAVRNEEFSTGQSDTIAKIVLVYEPFDWLGIRATFGEAFIAPTLSQLEDPEACTLSNLTDPFTGFSGFVTSCKEGNPGLVSETSESTTIGFDLAPTDNLTLSLTWSETDFTDRIVGTTTQDTVRTDFRNFQLATGFDPDVDGQPTLDQLREWLADSRSNKSIVRSANDITTVQMVIQSDLNASNMLVRATDLAVDYSIETRDWGGFRVNWQVTYVDTYEFQLSDLDPLLEGAGEQNNDFAAVAAIPRWRSN
ncbi:MAG: TonB-dependent receptor, partial [Gammaproteobacteria bacterium]|nr:TonB-dependent receptor [Gammaproteobacteria bacterium]